MIKAIIFDFAGVIGADGYWVWLRKVVPDIDSQKPYFLKLSEKVDRATISNKEFLEQLSKRIGVSKETIWPTVRKHIIINRELLKFIKPLKEKYKIGLLSNFTHEWLREVINENHLSEYFDQILISSEQKLIKPELEFFQKMFDLLGVNKEQVIFIDDRDYQVEAAEKFGIKSILFTSNEQLQRSLHDCFKEIS